MNQIQIGGFVPFTTVDYPGKLSAVIFLYGCPFRCVYCSNPAFFELKTGEYDPEKIIELLKSRVGKLNSVVFSGGEALMQNNSTIEYIKRVRNMGFLIGLHTNGYYPDVLETALPFIDWVGLDIKTNYENYEKLSGVKNAFNKIINSLDVLLKNNTEFEVRITCDPRFVSPEILIKLASDLSARGVKHFAIQKYNPHNENENNKTTESDRNQFFNDDILKKEIESLFESVIWRE